MHTDFPAPFPMHVLSYGPLMHQPIPLLMSHPIRLFQFVALLLFAAVASAQSYSLVVTGAVESCTPGSTVTVQTLPGTEPAQSVNVPVGPDCGFSTTLSLASATGGVFAWSTCGNGTVTGDSVAFSFNPAGDSIVVVLELTCGSDTVDLCQACITVQQTAPFNVQFGSCSSGGTAPYSYAWLLPSGLITTEDSPSFTFGQAGAYAVCMQVSDATGCSSVACDTLFVGSDGLLAPTGSGACQAGFLTVQAYEDTSNGGGVVAPIPNEVWAVNLSSPNTGAEQFAWDFGDGASSTETYPTHVYDGPGPWLLCLSITSDGCTDSFCDSVSVDADGFLNGMLAEEGLFTAGHERASGGFTLNVVNALAMGVEEAPLRSDLRLWPNPVQDELRISFTARAGGTVPVAVIDHTGRTLLEAASATTAGAMTLRLSTATLAPGLYVVRIGQGAGASVLRFVKQ